jgi:hypothetical protein
MAKLILAIEIPDQEALKIEAQAKDRRTNSVTLDADGIPQGYFNPDGRIALDSGDLECDEFDDCFFVFEYRGVERTVL